MTAPTWRRSSTCNADACVEVAFDGDKVQVRDTRTVKQFSRTFWADFIATLRAMPTPVGMARVVFEHYGLEYSQSELIAFADGIRIGEFTLVWLDVKAGLAVSS